MVNVLEVLVLPESNEKKKIVRWISIERDIPIWEKANLTLDEAAQYFNIGIQKLRTLSNSSNCNFVLYIGNKRLIKRKQLEKFLEDKTYL